jgi:hypothetical protein
LIAYLAAENAAMVLTQRTRVNVQAPIVLTIVSLVFILLSAAVVRVLGTDIGYKVLFVFFAFSLVLKTLLGW